jgi:hypothetical protein
LFAIDTTPPSVDDILLSPTSGIQPGSSINIKVTTEANLSQAAVVFNGDIVQLNPGLENPDVYVGTLQAPSTPGVYGLDILLVDQLSNEGSYKDKAKITVSNEGGSVETQETVIENTQQQTQQEQSQETQQNTQQDFTPITNTPPQKVSGMLSYPGNKKIVLVWDAATDSETFVKHYRVYYSNDPRNLNHYVDTKDASTTWYIPNLENGKEYYFAVSAFDSEEMESGALSEVVSGIPFTTEVASLPQVTDALVSNAHQSAPDIGNGPVHPGTGPEVLWLLFGSGAIGAVTRNFKKRSARIVKK